jgi:hypothetical protein
MHAPGLEESHSVEFATTTNTERALVFDTAYKMGGKFSVLCSLYVSMHSQAHVKCLSNI